MELTGRIKEIKPVIGTPQWELALTINEGSRLRDSYERLKDKNLDIKIAIHKKKRSLDANAYYWVLLQKLANKLEENINYLHNQMLRDCGIVEVLDGCLVYVMIPDTEKAARMADIAEKFHIKPTSQVRTTKKGDNYRTYIKLKGSHQFNTEEMGRLIDLLIQECRQQDIETATPAELERMLALYGETTRLRNEAVDNAGPKE